MQLRLFISAKAHHEIKNTPLFKEFLMESKARFIRQDWGDTSDAEKEANDRAVVMGADIAALYKMKDRPSKAVVIIVPYPRGVMQILTEKELKTFKNRQRQFVIYGPDGKPLDQ